MPKNTKVVNEDIADNNAVHDVNGKGTVTPTPVATGDVYANRNGTDLPSNSEADVLDVRGQEVSRGNLLAAIINQLVGMDNADLSQIVSAINPNESANAPGAAAAPLEGAVAKNLASIATHEEVKELFAGQNISEEFAQKATILFDAALGARLVAEKALIEEAAEARVEKTIQEVTDKLVGEIDRYMTFAAESVLAETKAELENATRNVKAESFIAGVLQLAEQYKIDSDANVSSAVAGLTAQVAALEAKLNEGVEREVTLSEELKGFRKDAVFNEVSGSLTALQRGRFKTLAEGIEFDSPDNYRVRLAVIKESVVAAAKPAAPAAAAVVALTESVDGVPALTPNETKVSSKDPVVKGVLSALGRQAR